MRGARAALIALASGQFVVGVTSLSPVGMVAEMRAALGVGTADIALLLTVFAVVYAVSAPLLQTVLGHLPRRGVMAGAMALSALSCWALALAQSWEQVAAARVAMALAAAVIGPTAAATAAALVAPERRAGALSLVFAGITVSSVAGVPASSWLAQTFGWREAWAAVGGAAAVCAGAAALTIPGAVRGARGSLRALFGVLAGRATGLSIGTTATLFAGGFVTYGLVAVWLEEAAGAPRAWIPAMLSAYGLLGVAANAASGRVVGRLGVERTIGLGLILSAGGAGLMAAAPTPIWLGVPGLAAMGVFWLMVMAPMQARLVRLAGDRAALALAFNSSALYVGMAVGSAASGAVYEAAGAAALPVVTAAGIALAAGVFALSRRGEGRIDARPAAG